MAYSNKSFEASLKLFSVNDVVKGNIVTASKYLLQRMFVAWTKELLRVKLLLQKEITERKKLENELSANRKSLETKNVALAEILGFLELEKKKISTNVIANAENRILPIIQKLKLKGESCKYVDLLKKNIQELTSSFSTNLTETGYKLTPREIEICDLIKHGLTSKEIAKLLNISYGTIERHRNNIRSKLDIVNQNTNLSSYLQSI